MLLLATTLILQAQPAASTQQLPSYSGLTELSQVVILDKGRCKPLDSWAWETVRGVTGRLQYRKHDQLAMLLDMAANPDRWFEEPLIRIDNLPLRQALGLTTDQKYFSYSEIRSAPGLDQLLQQLFADDEEKQTALQHYMQQLYGQMILCSDVLTGQAFTLVPDPTDPNGAWSTPFQPSLQDSIASTALQVTWEELLTAWQEGNESGFNSYSAQLRTQLTAQATAVYPTNSEVKREILYNHFRPFRKAIVIYLLLGITGLLGLFFRNTLLLLLNNLLLLAGLLLHSWGLYFITVIAGRAPLSHLYESLLFIVWGFVLIAFLFNLKYRESYLFVLTGLIGFIAMVLAHQATVDITINPLVPVLKSSWLVFHVTIILISYSAFGLAMGLGHTWLIAHRFFPGTEQLGRRLADFTYRVLQLGIVTLTIGIILGAMWANESWGRYWGWDPKETWSLITLLFYLGVVHARARGWARQKGMAMLSIIAFASVIMTYYGVNYFLTGLHSYAGGAAAGIPPILLGYIAFEVLFLVLTSRGKQVVKTPSS
ncbi:MAG: cytochrome c biogenesis protein CcsA [Candidatus Delongbacteria bacterium]|nr:cytochrome c biogenesis protein CcsA [Candidatus Delongbacteria bacterium]